MLDFMGNFAAVLITFIIVAGFVAVGAVLVFEITAMAVFWLKHVYRQPPNDVDRTFRRTTPLNRQPQP